MTRGGSQPAPDIWRATGAGSAAVIDTMPDGGDAPPDGPSPTHRAPPSRFGATMITVRSAEGIKWEIQMPIGTAMHSPVTYGLLPPGAFQFYPPQGLPVALAPGDSIEIEADGATLGGLLYFGLGNSDVP
jgi:hypothetical protein